MSYKGRYSPTYPKKYKGDHRNVVYRSLWERKFMVFCDLNENIIEWGSEEIAIPYRSPIDKKLHRYFPDFYVKLKENLSLKLNQKNNLNLPLNPKDKQKVIFMKHMSMHVIRQNGKQQLNIVKIDYMNLK